MRWARVLLLVWAAGCRRGGANKPALDAATDAVEVSVATGTRLPTTAALWPEARAGDALDWARLSDVEGVERLGEVAGDPEAAEDDRRVAIQALAFVADPTPALGTLTAVALAGHPQRSTLALETLAQVAPARGHHEELEPGAWRSCATALLGALPGLSGPRRAFAVQALLGMADRGAVARASIPP